ncbi:MAG: hypothetical protein ACOCPV_00090 [Halodesulfurarchaeum sp.]
MDFQPDRRSFLVLTGTSATAALAGCTSLDSQSTTDGEGEDSPGSEATLTAQVQPDQEELQTLQEDLQSEIEDGELSEEEAQQELQEKQAELTAEAVRSYEEEVADEESVTVEDSEPEYGILRISAPATTLVSTLEDGGFAALLSSEYYDQYIQQQEQQQALQEQMEEQTGEQNETETDE